MRGVRLTAALVAAFGVPWCIALAADAQRPPRDVICSYAQKHHDDNFYSCAPAAKFEREYKRWPKETKESLRQVVNRYELDRPRFEGQLHARPGDAAALKELGYFAGATPGQQAKGRAMAARLVACAHTAVHASQFDEGDSGYDMAVLIYPAGQVLSVRLQVPASLLLQALKDAERDLAAKINRKNGEVVDGGFHDVMNKRCSNAVTRAAERIVVRAAGDYRLIK